MIKRIEDFLQSKFITIPNEWVPACIEFIKEEHGNNNNIGNFNWLKEKIYEQWLHADLTDLGTCCLPFNLSKEKCITLKRQLALQVNHIKDIGLPAYSQLQKLRKDDVENANVSADKAHTAAWEPKPSRMLLLQLTDGTSVVQGMEYRPISAFSLSMKPGTKILLKGEIETRRGILLLTKDHVTVLGGEVEALVVPNATENILRRSLRLEESEHPISVPETFSSTPLPFESSQTQSQYYNTQSTQNSSYVNISNRPKALVTPTRTLPTTVSNQFDDDFEDFMDVETEMALLEAEQQASSGVLPRSQPKPLSQINQRSSNSFVNRVAPISSLSSQNSSGVSFSQTVSQLNSNFGTQASCRSSNFDDSVFEDDDDLLLAAAEASASSFSTPRNNSVSTARGCNPFSNSSAKKNPFVMPTAVSTLSTRHGGINNSLKSESKTQEKSVFSSANQMLNTRTNITLGRTSSSSGKGNLRQTKLSSFIFEKKIRNDDLKTNQNFPPVQDIKSATRSKPPYQYIYYMNLHPVEKVSYTVKGFVTTLLSKLEQKDGQWSLAVKINDGTGSCDVDIDNQVLRKLMGMSVEEFVLQKERAINDPQLRATLGQRVCKCQMELIRMCCLLKLEFSPNTSRPRLTSLISLTEEHLQQLKARSIQ